MSVFTCLGEFGLKVRVAPFVPPGICRDCRKSVFERAVSSVAGVTNADMEEGGSMCHALDRFGVAFTHTWPCYFGMDNNLTIRCSYSN